MSTQAPGSALTRKQHLANRNSAGLRAALMLTVGAFLYGAGAPEKKSEYTLQQDFFRAAVEDQIGGQSAQIYNDLIKQAEEKRRAGDLGAVLDFKIAGTVDLAKAEAEIPAKRQIYEKDLAARRQAALLFPGFFLIFGTMGVLSAAAHHAAAKKAPPAP